MGKNGNGNGSKKPADDWGDSAPATPAVTTDAPATQSTDATASAEDRLAVLERAHEELKAEWVAMKKVLTKFGIDLPNEVGVNAQYLQSISEETPAE